MHSQLRFVTLGGLSVTREDDQEGATLIAIPRRALAMLAVLATAPEGVTRERIGALLWPESDCERSRTSVRQALFVLRRALGAEAIQGTGVIRVDPEKVLVDVTLFEGALERGDLDRAVLLYRGPFLHGFDLAGVPEFDEWLDGRRSALARRFAVAATRCAANATTAGDHALAAATLSRLVELEPLNSAAVARLCDALIAMGNPSEARARLVRHREMAGGTLEGEILERADKLALLLDRVGIPAPTAADGQPPGLGSAEATPSLAPTQRAEPTSWLSGDALPESASPSAPRGERRFARRALGLPAFATALFAMLVIGSRVGHGAIPSPCGNCSPNLVAVMPFAVTATDEPELLREGVPRLALGGLDGAAGMRAVEADLSRPAPPSDSAANSIARRLGAGRYVSGEVVEAARRLRVAERLVDVLSGREIAHSTAEGNLGDLFAVADHASRELLAGAMGIDERLANSAALNTSSLAAFRHFLDGERAFRDARWRDAMNAFRLALDDDSTFALAAYRLSIVADRAAASATASEAAERAARFSVRLSTHDRQLVEGLAARRNLSSDSAEAIFRRVLVLWPNDPEATFQLAEALFHENGHRGRSPAEARPYFERLVDAPPYSRDALVHLAWLDARSAPPAGLDSLLRAALRGLPDTAALDARALRAFSIGSSAEQTRVLDMLERQSAETVAGTCSRLAIYSGNLDGAARICALLLRPSRTVEARSYGHALLAQLAAARGRPREALSHLQLMAPDTRTQRVQYAAAVLLAPGIQPSQEMLFALRDSLRSSNTEPGSSLTGVLYPWQPPLISPIRAHLLRVVDERLGDTADAESVRQQLTPAILRSDVWRWMTSSEDAQRALDRHDAPRALKILKERGIADSAGVAYFELAADRYRRGLALAAVGEPRQALTWFGTFESSHMWDLPLAAPGHLARARLFRQLGEFANATSEYRAFLAAWGDCEPELMPTVEAARRELAALQTDQEAIK